VNNNVISTLAVIWLEDTCARVITKSKISAKTRSCKVMKPQRRMPKVNVDKYCDSKSLIVWS
jgi:hypothetical protein